MVYAVVVDRKCPKGRWWMNFIGDRNSIIRYFLLFSGFRSGIDVAYGVRPRILLSNIIYILKITCMHILII